jgi:alkylhydroperoxidase family enzyme
MTCIAVSTASACAYRVHSRTAAAPAEGVTGAKYAEFLAIIGLVAQTNRLVTAMQLPVDPAFFVKGWPRLSNA